MNIKTTLKHLAHGPLSGPAKITYSLLISLRYYLLRLKWFISGAPKPTEEDVALIKDNVTIIFKSFERQQMAKRLYQNIQAYYPGVRVIIADDSAKPLELQGEHLEVIQLPFNCGLSAGLNRALEKVETPFVIRMDDDELLTPYTNWHGQLRFLMEHPQVDLVGVLPYNIPFGGSLERAAELYYRQPMSDAPGRLLLPHMTQIGEKHVVVGKAPNIFLVRTEKLKEVGYDDRIRMIDHNDFFWRAAGRMVSVLDKTAYVLHYHNRFDEHYQKFRADVDGDRRYIAMRKYMRQ